MGEVARSGSTTYHAATVEAGRSEVSQGLRVAAVAPLTVNGGRRVGTNVELFGRVCRSRAPVLPALLTVSLAAPPVSATQNAPKGFWSDPSPLSIEIEADLYGLRVEDRHPDAAPRPGVLRVLSDPPSEVRVLLETRGRFRLDRSNCRYPPLRVTILADSVERLPAALADFGRRARLVWSCRPGQEDLVRLEYAAYRIRGALDHWTYRVRPAKARFIDRSGRDETHETWVFFREGNAHLRPRLGVEEVELPDSVAVDPAVISQVPAALNEVFQYLIGNTDWSVSARHNQRLVVTPLGEYRTVPYDFDSSGFVDAPYATPGSYLPTTDVTERLFRGLCRPSAVYIQAIEKIAAEEPALLAVIDSIPELSEGRAREARRYLSEFFREARRPDRLARYFGSACQERN